MGSRAGDTIIRLSPIAQDVMDTNTDPPIYEGNLEQLSTAKTLVKAIMPRSSNQGQNELCTTGYTERRLTRTRPWLLPGTFIRCGRKSQGHR